jgi:hypothetical protein
VPGEKPEERWFPDYSVPINGRDIKVRVEIFGKDGPPEGEECPVSLLRRNSWGPEIRNMVTEIGRAYHVKEGTGAWPGGMDSAAWDARWYDAVGLAETERRKLERAIDLACEGVRRQGQGGVA